MKRHIFNENGRDSFVFGTILNRIMQIHPNVLGLQHMYLKGQKTRGRPSSNKRMGMRRSDSVKKKKKKKSRKVNLAIWLTTVMEMWAHIITHKFPSLTVREVHPNFNGLIAGPSIHSWKIKHFGIF